MTGIKAFSFKRTTDGGEPARFEVIEYDNGVIIIMKVLLSAHFFDGKDILIRKFGKKYLKQETMIIKKDTLGIICQEIFKP